MSIIMTYKISLLGVGYLVAVRNLRGNMKIEIRPNIFICIYYPIIICR